MDQQVKRVKRELIKQCAILDMYEAVSYTHLVVSFGTIYQETREKNIDQMVALVREQYPNYLVEEAYSSSTVRKVLRERDGIAKDDVRQALCRMRDAGVRRVIVFPTHISDEMCRRDRCLP